ASAVSSLTLCRPRGPVMSSYLVISHISETIKTVLWDAFNGDERIKQFIKNESDIVFTNPTQAAAVGQNRLSIWLHHITENEFEKNRQPRRANGANQHRMPPLALNLFYLITPFAPNAQEPTAEHILLGKVMQVFYDNAILPAFNAAQGEE